MAYRIKFTGPIKSETYLTYFEALDACRNRWPNVAIGHDGDLSEGGDRTCVWETEADAKNDDGGKAVASIVRVSGPDGEGRS